MQRDPVTLDLHLIAGTENFGGLSTDGSTHAPIWLPHRGVMWSRNPDTGEWHTSGDCERASVGESTCRAHVERSKP
jgi:hypothetical protein